MPTPWVVWRKAELTQFESTVEPLLSTEILSHPTPAAVKGAAPVFIAVPAQLVAAVTSELVVYQL
jgi:hypothetical protein